MQEDEDVLEKGNQEKVLSWLEAKWPKQNRCCEICGKEKWGLNNSVSGPSAYSSTEIKCLSSVCQQLGLTCRNCGNIKFLDASVMGIVG